MKVTDKIRLVREQKEYSQEFVAEQLGLSVNGYGKIERGEVNLTVERLQQIAKVLEVPVEEFLRLDSQAVYINNFNQNSGNNGNVNCFQNSAPLTEKEYYEAEIQHLKDVISYLKEIIRLKEQIDNQK